MNYLAMGAKVLQDKMETYAGIRIEYRRKGRSAFNLIAVPGRNPTDILDQNGVMLRAQVFDFIVNIESLKIGLSGSEQRPMRGDEIVAEIADQRMVFMVNGEDIATSHYEPADSYGYAWRIHTKVDRVIS